MERLTIIGGNLRTDKELEEVKNLKKLLNKIADKIDPNSKENIKLYLKDLKRQTEFKDLARLSEEA